MTDTAIARLVIADGWDAEKARAHLADLQTRKDTALAIAEAMTNAARGHEREAARLDDQITHCLAMFREPRDSST